MSKRPRGRPPLADNDPSVVIDLRVPGKVYDQLYREARTNRMSVPELLRAKLRVAVKPDPSRAPK